MMTFLVTIAFFALVISAMAVGVLMGRQPLQGSCGGLGNIQGLGECDICGGDPSKCEEQESSSAANTENKIEQKSFYEA